MLRIIYLMRNSYQRLDLTKPLLGQFTRDSKLPGKLRDFVKWSKLKLTVAALKLKTTNVMTESRLKNRSAPSLQQLISHHFSRLGFTELRAEWSSPAHLCQFGDVWIILEETGSGQSGPVCLIFRLCLRVSGPGRDSHLSSLWRLVAGVAS